MTLAEAAGLKLPSKTGPTTCSASAPSGISGLSPNARPSDCWREGGRCSTAPLSHSAAYHTFRFWFGWEPIPGGAWRTSPCALCT